MSRRALSLLALVVAGALSAGCADDVSPAARIGDDTEITHEELLAEVDDWARSDTLLGQLGVAAKEGAGPGSYSTDLVDLVLTNRIRFHAHHEQFEALDLTVSDQDLADVRSGLFQDPAVTQAVLAELDGGFADRLVTAVAEQFAVSQAMAPEEYTAWQTEALTDVEVSPRYGTWDRRSGSVLPPDGPRPAPGAEPLVP